MQTCNQLLNLQRLEQSGYMLNKMITGCIHVIHIMDWREFWQGKLAGYVNLKKEFDSVPCKVLWNLIWLFGIPAVTVDLLTGLYSEINSAVKCLFCEHRSEAVVCSCPFTIQYIQGWGVRQSFGAIIAIISVIINVMNVSCGYMDLWHATQKSPFLYCFCLR